MKLVFSRGAAIRRVQLYSRMLKLCCWLCCVLVDVAFSAESYRPKRVDPLSEPWRWRHITPLDEAGFRCMEEGPDGSMWFGVNQGVLNYDGLHWKSFTQKDGFTDRLILWICRASDGSIYAANPHGLWCFREEVWTRVPLEMRIRCLKRSDSGVWVGTDEGAWHIGNDGKTFYGTKSGIAAASKKVRVPFATYRIPDQIVQSGNMMVSSICEDRRGRVWFAINKQHLIRFHPDQGSDDPSNYQFNTHKENGLLIRLPVDLKRSHKNEIWLSTAAGIYRFNDTSNRWNRRDQPSVNSAIGKNHSLLLCKDNTILFAILNNLFVKRGDEWTNYPIPSQEQSSPRMMEASDGSLWVGKEQGKVFRIDRQFDQWISYKDLHFQCDDIDGRSWFLTSDNRAVFLKRGKGVSYSSKDGLPDTLLAIYRSNSGQIWAIGSHQHTAATAYFKDGRWIRDVHSKLGECFDARVGAALSDGSIVFATQNPRKKTSSGGLLYAMPKKDGGYSFKKEVFPSRYSGLTGYAEVAPGDHYCSMFRLYRKNGDGVFETVPTPLGGQLGHVDALTSGESQQLWLSFRDYGICHLNGTNWVSYTPADGLGSSRVSSLACVKDGTIWASMAHGFSRFNGRQWQSNILDPALPGIAAGAGSLKLNRFNHLWINYCPSSWYVREGRKIPNIEDEYFSFKTVRYRPLKDKPETELIVYSQEVSSEGNVFFEWSGVARWELTPQKELTYSWRLDDGEWSPYSKKTNQLFLSLEPGEYRFEVRARDRDFNVDLTPAGCSFMVLLPVWQQSWFILMVSLFSIGLLLLAYFLIRAKADAQRHQIEIEQIKLRFFTSISHEFRTPLTVMLAPLQSLLESIQDAKAKDTLRMVINSGQKLHRLVDQVLDFRKLDSGRMPVELTQSDIVEFTELIITELEPLAEQSEITIRKHIPVSAHMIWFDPDKWQKITSNLVSNAIKFTPPNGWVDVTLEVVEDGNEPERIVLTIEDSGIGVPEEEQEHIFEPYYRAKSAAKGTGIGLSFVKQLVDLLNGEIQLESPIITDQPEPCGTRFCIELPVTAQPPEDQQNPVSFDAPEMPDISAPPATDASFVNGDGQAIKPSLLVVDDSADIRKMIQSELSEYYSILQAENGAIGFDVAKDQMPDLILSDLMMPVMDGLELCKKLKADEVTSHIPVIMLTARTSQENELEGLDSGADDYITKPFTLPILNARIHRQLEARRIMREHFGQKVTFEAAEISINSVDQTFLERAISLINDRISDEDFNSERLAEAMGMKERTFRNKIKAMTDLTPMTLIRRQRLEFAKQLLEQPNQQMTVSEIGSSVCFYDVGYFAKVFKKQFGVNPSEVLNGSK